MNSITTAAMERLCADPVAHWLLFDARDLARTREVVGGLAECLVANGFPLYRLFFTVRTLHPQVLAIGHEWRRDTGATAETPRAHGILQQDIYLRSPIRLIHQGAAEVRRRIGAADAALDFPILAELRRDGCTDYLILPLTFSRGRINAVSAATDRGSGFTDAEIERLKSLMPLLSVVLELKETERIGATLLDIYLGHDAGRRVLGGLIRRGEGITLAAALWYCDLRNFTATTEKLPRDAVIAMLNDYFECMVGSIHAHGGQVLKFIGDALLAIFPIADDLDRDRACLAALAAAEQALADLARLNQRRRAAGRTTLQSGIALHTGPVTYGNIGAPERLDFTVIGSAVNFVTRLERLCSELGRPLLASARFASPCGSKLQCIGRHRLRGIDAEQEVYALPAGVESSAGDARVISVAGN